MVIPMSAKKHFKKIKLIITKYITTSYFKRAFFIINSKGFLSSCMPDTLFKKPNEFSELAKNLCASQ